MKNTVFKKYNVLGDDLYYHHTSTAPSDEQYLHSPETHLQYELLYLLDGELCYMIEGITVKKMAPACELSHDGYSAHDAAEAVGYENYTSFFYNFKKTMGFSPICVGKKQ